MIIAAAGTCSLALAAAPVALGAVAIPGPPLIPPSSTPPTALGALDVSRPVISFAGPDLNSSPLPLVNSPVPAVCLQPLCQEYSFSVPTTESFLVSVKGTVTGPNGEFNANDGFDLYVYNPAGSLVGSANGIGANGQSLQIDGTSLGTYTIVVTFTYLEDQGASYTGEVRLNNPVSWSPGPCTSAVIGGTSGCFALPQLEVLPPYDLATAGVPPVASTPLGFPLPSPATLPTSCYLDETLPIANPSVGALQQPTTRCLRFSSDVRNVGAGPLQIRIPLLTGSSGVTLAYLPGECNAEQVVTSSAGDQVIRPGGSCLFHLQHLHFHYSDLLAYTLYSVAQGGGVGSKVGSSAKASFCLSDDDYFGFATPGPNSQRDFTGQPGCNVPDSVGAAGAFIDEGIKPGWGDVYTWDTPGQYIDVTNTPAGTYDLIEETNPTGALLVSGPQQTCAETQLQLTSTTVQILSQSPSVPCPA